MNAADGQQQLWQYAQSGSEEAFAGVVAQYIDLVYSTALRLMDGDAHQAEDIAQVVFIDLARLAPKLSREVKLGGWLHRHTCFIAAKHLRSERRRRFREAQAVSNLQDVSETDMSEVAPQLDQAINALGEQDREAILLRFFEKKNFQAVGLALGMSDDAARIRVNRALTKLEKLLRTQGVTTTAASLSVLLASNVVHSAPAGLAAAISTAAIETAGAHLSGAVAMTKALAMTNLQKSFIAAVIAAVGAGGLYQAHRISMLHDQLAALRQRQAPLAIQLDQSRLERDQATQALAALDADYQRLRRDNADLPKLRGEIARLRIATNETAPLDDPALEDNLWAAKVRALKQLLDQSPGKKIPELAILKDSDWLQAAKEADLKTQIGTRRALNDLRTRAKQAFGRELQQAFQRYAAANNDQLPAALAELKPYFNSAVGNDILQRYSYDKSGLWSQLMPGEPLVGNIAPPVDVFDSQVQVTSNGMGVDNPVIPEDENLLHVLDAYFAANSTREPKNLSDLQAYARTPAELEAIRKFIQAESAGK